MQHQVYSNPKKESKAMLTRSTLEIGNFKKLHKIKDWAAKPWQINHKIIAAFLFLERQGKVERSLLKRYCIENLRISTFEGNFASMKTDSAHSHGKIFYEENSRVKIWEPARKEIDLHFAKFIS